MSRFELPAELAWVLRPHLAELTVEVAAALQAADDGLEAGPVRLGVGEALRQFVDDVELGHAARPRRLFANFGRTELRAGRPLEPLLEAYRLGGRLAWRRFAGAAQRANVASDTIHALAEAVFSWVDELGDQSAAGYAAEASATASAAQLRRERVVRLLVADPPAAAGAVQAAADQAGWSLPATLAVAALAADAGGLVPALPPGMLGAPVGDALCLLVPEPRSRARELAAVLEARGLRGALGPAVAPGDAARSWRRADALRTGGLAPGAGLVAAEDHLAELLVAADPELAAELRARVLAPLDGLTARQRERLAATLLSWLAHRGALKPIAAELGIHPQTVRYRVARLRERFGPAVLEQPATRFALELALRSRPGAAASE